jgi:hypothetical protein
MKKVNAATWSTHSLQARTKFSLIRAKKPEKKRQHVITPRAGRKGKKKNKLRGRLRKRVYAYLSRVESQKFHHPSSLPCLTAQPDWSTMPASEIDDIFSGKASTSKAAVIEPATSSKKEKKSKKRKSSEAEAKSHAAVADAGNGSAKGKKTTEGKREKDGQGQQVAKKGKVAETVIDPSKVIEAKGAKKQKATQKKLDEEDEDFKDTRGKKSECFLS